MTVIKIIDIDVSDNAAQLINTLCESFKRPVRFIPMEDSRDGTAGGIDPMDQADTVNYTVRLPSGLDRRMFEANVLYELFHIRQFEAGFPTLGNKDSLLFTEDREFVEDLGGLVFSCALDPEIFDRLRKCRYNDAVRWFGENLYNGLVSAASHKFSYLDDKYNSAHLTVTFSKVLYHTDSEQDAKIRGLFVGYPLVLERSFKIREMLRSNLPDTPESAAASMGRVLEILDLWDLFYVMASGRRIRTKTEFESFYGS